MATGATGGAGRSVHTESRGLLSTAINSAPALEQTAASRSAAAEVCSHGSNPRRSPAPRCFASQLSGEGSISGSTLQAFASTCFAACSVYRPSTNTAAACVNTIAIPADPVNPARQLLAKSGQPRGQRNAAFGLFECLEMGFEHRLTTLGSREAVGNST